MGCGSSRPSGCPHGTKLINGLCEPCRTITGSIQSMDGHVSFGQTNNLTIELCGDNVDLSWVWDKKPGKPRASIQCLKGGHKLDCNIPQKDGSDSAYYTTFTREGDWGTDKARTGSWAYGDLWPSPQPSLRRCYTSWNFDARLMPEANTPTKCLNEKGKWKHEQQMKPVDWKNA